MDDIQDKNIKNGCMVKKEFLMAIMTGVILGLCLFYGMFKVVQLALNPIKKNVEYLTQELSKMQRFEKALEQLEKTAQQKDPEPKEDYSKVYDLPIGRSYVLGNPQAPITIVEFSDIECPFCSRFHPVIKDVLKAYPDKVKIVFKHYPLPFHQQARLAAKAVLAAGLQGKAFELLDVLFLNNKNLSKEKIQELVKLIGLDEEKFIQDLNQKDADFEKILAEDLLLVKQADVRGTPTYFLNGKKTNARTLEAWKQEIDALLK